jgi:hypothetical protein
MQSKNIYSCHTTSVASIGNILRLECNIIISALFVIGGEYVNSNCSKPNEDIETRDLWTNFYSGHQR